MKKKLFSLLTALVLCLLCAVPAFAEMPLVMDTYELFKPEATAELEQKAQDASAGHGVNVYLLTVSDIGGQNVREFAKDWYRDYDLGYGEGKSGILFLIALDSRDYVTITYGGGVTAFTDYRIAQIEDKIVPMLSDGTYYKASETYIEMCADTLDFYAEKGVPLDSGNDPAKGWIKWVFVFVIPLAVACDAPLVPQALLKGLSQGDADVLHGVVVIHLRVPLALDGEIEIPVAGKEGEHVVQKPTAGFDVGCAGAV